MPPLNLNRLKYLLGKISYKPGWKIQIREVSDFADFDSFDVILVYEGYESQNAAFDPIAIEIPQVSDARRRIAVSIGRSYRQDQTYAYFRRFSKWDIENMPPESIIKYVIGDTIKEAEMFEFERWFKYEGVPIFEHREEEKEHELRIPSTPRWVR